MKLDGRQQRLTGERPVDIDDIEVVDVVDVVEPVGRRQEPQ